MKAEILIDRVRNLPAPSLSVTRLISLLQHHDTDVADVIRVIKQDPVLCAKLLALCNSASHRAGESVASLDQAILRLGQRETHRLVMTMGFGDSLGAPLPGYMIDDTQLWRHSLLTAYATGFILKLVPRIQTDPSIAYTAGLIHDIGKLVLNQALTDNSRASVQELVDSGRHSLVEAEREVIGADHAEVGAVLLRRWKIPEVIVEAVADHHVPPSASPPPLSAVVHIADVLAHESGCSPGFGSYAVRARESTVEALGLGPSEIQGLVLNTFEACSEIDAMVTTA